MREMRQSTPVREWLFKDGGQVFGPVPESRFVELVEQGRVGPATEVACEGGEWRPLANVPGFLVHIKKAEARARVHAEVTGSRKLEQRRRALHAVATVLGAVVLVGAAGYGAWFLAVKRPWEKRSALLDGFGDGIAISSVQVGGSRRSLEVQDEIAIPNAQQAAQRVRRAGPARAGGGEIEQRVLAKYDAGRIKDVVARRQGSLAPCLREEAQRSPEFSGQIPIEFAVGNEGKIVALWIDEPRFKSGPLRDCLLARLREWNFDVFPGERPSVQVVVRMR